MSIYEEIRQHYLKIFQSNEELMSWYRTNSFREGMRDEFLCFICGSTVLRTAFLSKYKSFPPLEELEQEQKVIMKKTVHAMFPGQTVQFKLEAAKTLYTFNNLL